MATFHFDFVGPERTLYSGEVNAVQLPGIEGEMTVMAGHAPVLTSLLVGVIVITESQGSGKRIYVRGGFADIGPTGLTVLAERAAPIEELNAESLDRDIEAVQLQYDATEDLQRREELNAQIVQLRETKALLKL